MTHHKAISLFMFFVFLAPQLLKAEDDDAKTEPENTAIASEEKPSEEKQDTEKLYNSYPILNCAR